MTLLDDLKAISQSAKLTATEIKKARSLIKRSQEEIEITQNSINEAEVSDPSYYAMEARGIAIEAGRGFFMENATRAAATSEEYAYDQFLSPLLEVADDPNLYKTKFVGAGWNTRLEVELAMDEIAGTLEDYAEGVELARAALNVKEDRDPVRASELWRDRFYKGKRYYTTINLRLAATVGKAPFWSLLNNGNKNVNMMSDIGGTAYPDVAPTYFVQETEAAIANEFRFLFSGFRDRSVAYINDLQIMINEMQRAISAVIEKIDGGPSKGSGGSSSQEAQVLDTFAKEIGIETSKLSATKLHKAIAKVEAGEYLPAQITVSAKGEKRKRIRRKKFLRVVSSLGD